MTPEQTNPVPMEVPSGGGVNLTGKRSPHSVGNRLARVLWGVVQATLFRWSPRPLHRWRVMLLRVFGGDIHATARPYPGCRVWGPWNLTMGPSATIADGVDVYCVDRISIGGHTTVSQYSYLCGATHDHEHPRFPLVPRPITIGGQCWIAADVYVAPGVTIGEGSVIGARSSVFGDIPPWTVAVGTPAKPVKPRVIREASPE
jgi:putative colanic acid biosynthesis acetyltransferase WcaF